jgi:hypothetical protein
MGNAFQRKAIPLPEPLPFEKLIGRMFSVKK